MCRRLTFPLNFLFPIDRIFIMDLSDHSYFFANETRRDWDGDPGECCPDCDNFEEDCCCGSVDDDYDGQPDEAQEWYDFDPDC
jgi:hypothetical protein